MEISTREFLIQLGPDFLQYERILIENEFRDSSSLRAMDLDYDLDVMFRDPPLPLGHKRKLQMTIKNLKSATQLQSDDIQGPEVKPIESTCSSYVPENEDPQKKCSMDKVCDKMNEDIKKKELELKDLMDKRKSLDISIPDPEPVGPFKNTRCGNCHMRGHKSDGNRGNKPCSLPPCNSWKDCGQKDKHVEYKKEVKCLDKEIKSMEKELQEQTNELNRVQAFKEKTTTSFISIIKDRLRATNPQKYLNTNVLMRDVITLKNYYKDKVPTHPQSMDREEFSSVISNHVKKSLARYKVPLQTAYEDISDPEEPPRKKITASNTAKPATITSPPQNSIDKPSTSTSQQNSSAYGTFPYNFYPGYYGYNPFYYSAFPYQNFQPPLPLDPPPQSPPQPDSD